MMEDPRSIGRVFNVIWILRSLERIGDHSRSLCQHLVYLINGVNVRHMPAEQLEKVAQDDKKI